VGEPAIAQSFWVPLVQQTVLTTIYVCTRKSSPSSMTAHLVMNSIAACIPTSTPCFLTHLHSPAKILIYRLRRWPVFPARRKVSHSDPRHRPNRSKAPAP
jgi:hypothetical protein